jgi:hypothetical protein
LFCTWTGTNFTGEFDRLVGPWGEWLTNPSRSIKSLWNHRTAYVTWISDVKDYDTSVSSIRAEACVPTDDSGAIFPSSFANLWGYIYPVGPGSAQTIYNNVVGVEMSNWRRTCPQGTTPYAG